MLETPDKLSILYYEPYLEHRICSPVTPEEFQQRRTPHGELILRNLAGRMRRVCEVKEGYAVAAPQLGIFSRFFYFAQPHGEMGMVINPVIQRFIGAEICLHEACLSLPPHTAAAPVKRSATIEVTYQRLDGSSVERKLTGFNARIFQHEVDHLDGAFFINRVPAMLRDIVLDKYRRYMERTWPPPNRLKPSRVSAMQQK
jgi:peptide deformylase